MQTMKRSAFDLVAIPAGSFAMGSPDDEWGRDSDEGPQRKVSVKAFALARYPVTNAEYARYLDAHPEAPRPDSFDDPRFNGPRHPVVCVSWLAAQRFAAWAGGRLPTEPEWEYAGRAGTITSTYLGDIASDDDPRLNAIAWHRANSDRHTHPVGEKLPNRWGLHDMLGNVWEWCANPYQPYPPFPGPASQSERVLRGGCWNNRAKYARAARRDEAAESFTDSRVGFRLAFDAGL
jgi:formylglycine-generating enzyme required for sulfatase activity